MIACMSQFEIPQGGLWDEVRPWLESLVAEKYQPTSIRFLLKSIQDFERFIRKRKKAAHSRDVRSEDMEEYRLALVRRKLSAATQENYLQTAKSFFAWQEKRGMIFASPARGLKVPRRPRGLKYVPTEKELVHLIESISVGRPIGQRDLAIVEVAYGSGLRLNELAQLNLDSIDLERRMVRVMGKGQRMRIVPLTRTAVAALRAYLAGGRKALLKERSDEEALWICRKWPTRLKPVSVAYAITIHATSAGLDLSPHDLRRAFATHMLIRGISPVFVAKMLGHATYSHLDEYLRYAPTDLIEIHRRCRPGR